MKVFELLWDQFSLCLVWLCKKYQKIGYTIKILNFFHCVRVSNRAQENRKKLDELKRRIDVAEAKINHVKGSNRAIQVFSSSKYPAPNQLQNYVSVFNGKFFDDLMYYSLKIYCKFVNFLLYWFIDDYYWFKQNDIRINSQSVRFFFLFCWRWLDC